VSAAGRRVDVPVKRRRTEARTTVRPRVSRVAFAENTTLVAWYSVHERAVARAQRLIDGGNMSSTAFGARVQPRAEDENAFLESHSWDEYAEWHLGLTEEASDQTKAGTRSCTATSDASTGRG
jgi:hypothetical protein